MGRGVADSRSGMVGEVEDEEIRSWNDDHDLDPRNWNEAGSSVRNWRDRAGIFIHSFAWRSRSLVYSSCFHLSSFIFHLHPSSSSFILHPLLIHHVTHLPTPHNRRRVLQTPRQVRHLSLRLRRRHLDRTKARSRGDRRPHLAAIQRWAFQPTLHTSSR